MKEKIKGSEITKEVYKSPYRLIGVFVFTILFIEIVLMLLLPYFPPLPKVLVASLDALLLVLLLVPELYFFVIRPMIKYIGNLKKAEKQLRNEKEFSESLIRTANVIIIGLNEHGEITLMNEIAQEISGYSFEELKGKNWFETLVPKEKYPQVWEEFTSLTKIGKLPRNFENPMLTKSGEERFISWQNGVLHKQKKLVGTISYGIDITEKMKADEVLANLNRKHQLILNSAAEGILGIDLQGNHTFMNSAASEMLGYSTNEILGQPSHSLWHHSNPDGTPYPEDECNIFYTLKDGTVHRVSNEVFWRKDNSAFPVIYDSTPIYEHNQVVGAVVTFTDTTIQKRLELENQIQFEIAQSITLTTDLDELLKLIHNQIRKVVYAENCFFALYEEKTGLFSFPYYVDQFDETPSPVAIPKSCTAYVHRSGESLIINPQLFEKLKEQNEVELVGSPSPSWIGVPLKTSERIIGILVLQHYEEENIYNDDHLRFLNSIGSQVANVIERKRAEDELKQSFSLLNASLESTADGILVVDKQGNITNFNTKFVELWQIPESIIKTRNDEKLLAFVIGQLKDPEGFLKKVEELYLNEEEISFDVLEFKDGRTFERYSQSHRLDGRIVGRVWSFHDISKLKLTEKELRESERKFRTFFDMSPIGIEIYDGTGDQIDANPASLEMFGISDKSSVLGFNLFNGTSLSQNMKSNLLAGNPVEYTFSFNFDRIRELNQYQTSRTGKAVMQYSITPLKSADEIKMLGYLLLVQDITKRKLAEEALKASETSLRELNATKDKFFSIIAHDLKNPFNSIIGFSSLLSEQIKNKDFEGIGEFADIIESSSHKVYDLLLNLLEWSRSQTGRIEFNPEYFEMVKLIEVVAELFTDSAQQKSIRIIRKNPHNAIAFADKSMISTVLRNLISNAIKFTNPGGEIAISAQMVKDELMISVSDNGVGIRSDVIEKLFKIEESYTTTGTSKEIGTGLGLILCKEFVEKHGGKIWVESEVGKGSTFSFKIPKV